MTRNIKSTQLFLIVLLASLLTLVTPAPTSLNQLEIEDEPGPVDSAPRDGVQDHANIFGGYFYCIYPSGKYPDLKDCSRYYECRYWRPSHKKCPRNQHFDSKSEKCESKEIAVCGKGGGGKDKEKSTTETSVKITTVKVTTTEPVRMCPSLFGKYPQPHDCSKYVVCVLGRPLEEKCRRSELYDDKEQKCRSRKYVTCGSRIDPEEKSTTETSVKITTVKVTTTEPVRMCPSLFGKYPQLHDCSKYVVCVLGRPLEEKCGLLKLYDDKKQKCRLRILVNCGSRIDPEGPKTTTEFGSTSTPKDLLTVSTSEDEEFGSTSRPEDIVTGTTSEDGEFSSTSRPDDIVTGTASEDGEFGSTSRPEDIVTESTTEDGEFDSTSRPEDIVTGTTSEDGEFGSTSRPEDIVTGTTSEVGEFGSTSRPDDIVTGTASEDGEFGSTSRPEDIVTDTTSENGEFGSTSRPEDIVTGTTPEDEEFGSTSVPQDIITGSTSEDEVFGSTSRPDDIRTGSISTKDNIGISSEDRGTETTSISEQTETGEISSSESITASDGLTTSTDDSSSLKPTDCKEHDLDCIIKETRFVCPKQYGHFAHPSSKSLFIHCDNFRHHVTKCGQGLVFSPEYLICVRPT